MVYKFVYNKDKKKKQKFVKIGTLFPTFLEKNKRGEKSYWVE